MSLRQHLLLVAFGLISLPSPIHAQDFAQLLPSTSSLAILFQPPDLALYPLTHGNASVRIPDIDQSLAIFMRWPDFQNATISASAMQLLNRKAPHAQVLQDIDDLFGYRPPHEMPRTVPPILKIPFSEGGMNLVNHPGLSYEWTTLSGSSFWYWPTLLFAFAGRCQRTTPTSPSASSELYALFWPDSLIRLEPNSNQSNLTVEGEGCAPRVLAHGRVGLNTRRFPVFQDVIKAQFDMIVEVLRNKTALPILESVRVRSGFTRGVEHDALGERVVQVAGLPSAAAYNMRGFLTVRQYALYQLLKRRDSDCPISPTDCGLDQCDEYPLMKAVGRQAIS